MMGGGQFIIPAHNAGIEVASSSSSSRWDYIDSVPSPSNSTGLPWLLPIGATGPTIDLEEHSNWSCPRLKPDRKSIEHGGSRGLMDVVWSGLQRDRLGNNGRDKGGSPTGRRIRGQPTRRDGIEKRAEADAKDME